MTTEAFKQYLAGFIDGDGSIYIQKQKHCYVLNVTLSQSNESFIDKIHSHYQSFSKRSRNNKVKENSRLEYNLGASNDRAFQLLSDIEPYSILKHKQVLYALEFLKLNSKQKNARKHCYEELKRLKKNKNNPDIPLGRLNEIYVAGLFDAEGCILSRQDCIKITQKSSQLILEKIAEFYQLPLKLENYALKIYSKIHARHFLESIKPYCIYKKPQINVYLNESMSFEEKKTLLENLKKEDHNAKTTENEDIVYMKEIIQDLQKYSYEELIKMRKYEQLLGITQTSKFDNKIFDSLKYDKIEPELEFVERTDKFHYYLAKTSSVAYNQRPGINIKILVKDKITQKYLGLLQLSDPVLSMTKRDDYIPSAYLQNALDITVCVPLQPFGFNTNGGKLLAMLCFSKEIAEYYRLNYNKELKYIYTTSLYGKSIMYDRLKCLKYIGNTEGYGVLHIPPLAINKLYELNARRKLIHFTKKNNLHFMKAICGFLKEPDITFHNHPKGVYMGVADIGKQTIQEIYDDWYNKYALRRINNLVYKNEFDTRTPQETMYSAETFSFQKVYQLPGFDSNLDYFKTILKYKTRDDTYKDLERLIYNKEKIKISSTRIQQIFQGKVRPKTEDQEYLELLEQEKPRKRAPKYTPEELKFIQKYINKPENEIQDKFYHKFNKEIPLSTIKTMKKTYNPQEHLKKTIPDVSEENTQSHPDTHIMHIMRMKKDPCTLQEIRKKLRETHNIRIGTVLLNKIWNGEYKQIDTPEFRELLKYQRKKRYYQSKSEDTKKKMSESIKQAVAFRKILTDSEEQEIAEALKDNTRFPTQASVCKYFTEKFGKPVKRHIVYAIQKKLET